MVVCAVLAYLTVVTERWMSQVMSEAGSLYHIRVQTSPRFDLMLVVLGHPLGKSAAHLCHLQGVCQAVVENVPFAGRRHLGDTA